MTAKLSCFILLLIITFCVSGQDTIKPALFLNGIYLSNFTATIPWSTNYKSVVSVGNPVIDTASKGAINYKWNSAEILNGVTINLRLSITKKQVRKHTFLRVVTFYGTIADDDLEKIKRYLTSYTKDQGVCYDNKNEHVCYWKINGCNLRVGKYKGHHEMTGSFFDIQKSLPKQNGM